MTRSAPPSLILSQGRPRKHPRPEDVEGGVGAGSGSGEEGGDPLNALVDGALKTKQARGRPSKGDESPGRSGKKRKADGDDSGCHFCPRCNLEFLSVYDMYEHLRDCGGASSAGRVGVSVAAAGTVRGGGSGGGGSAAKVSAGGGGASGKMSAAAGAGMAQPHLQTRVLELEAQLAEMKALAAAAASSPFAAAWRDPAFAVSTAEVARQPPPPSSPPAVGGGVGGDNVSAAGADKVRVGDVGEARGGNKETLVPKGQPLQQQQQAEKSGVDKEKDKEKEGAPKSGI